MKKPYEPERRFFGGGRGFFGGSGSFSARPPRESMWQFFNRILYNRGSIERNPRDSLTLSQKFNRLFFNRGDEGDQ